MRTAHCVTPPGRSAIGSIVVTGLESVAELEPFFQPAGPRRLVEYQDGRIIFGHWTNQSGSSEELVVTKVSATEAHVHCHGGPAAIKAILANLEGLGCQVNRITRVDWNQGWTNLEAEIECGLLNAPTRLIANYFLQWQQGRFRQELNKLATLIQTQPTTAVTQLEALIETYTFGLFLTRPIKVVLAGPPNVGKSTINNQILGFERSITYDQPGTTRDVVSETTTIDGWSFEFSDTAGIRESADLIEEEGVTNAQRQIKTADLTVWVESADNISSVTEWKGEVSPAADERESKQITVFNKSDLFEPHQLNKLKQRFPNALFTIANKGEGIGSLMQSIKKLAVDHNLIGSDIVLFTSRQYGLANSCLEVLKSGDLEGATNFLSRIIEGQ